QIKAYRRVNLKLQLELGPTEITLINVAYVLEFLTNCVSLTKLNKADIHFNSKRKALYRGATKESLCTRWHVILGHTGPKAIKHLPSAAIGAEVSSVALKTIDCIQYSISKAQ
ncbi:hypothetical protein K432DRAFT_298422, partial [Lepidopterella palustris CBS 459.81]